MNPNYTEFKFPQIKAHPWHKVLVAYCIDADFSVYLVQSFYCIVYQIFHKRMPPEAVDLVSRLLQYSPNLRSTAVSISYLFFFLKDPGGKNGGMGEGSDKFFLLMFSPCNS